MREQDGLIWVYMAAQKARGRRAKTSRRASAYRQREPRWIESQLFACAIDHAVIGLMDPAHAPYVHGRWWWRKTPRVKEKHYAPLPNGFVMTRHKPTKPMYALLGADVADRDHLRTAQRPLREHHRARLFGAAVIGSWVSPPARRATPRRRR